MPPRTGPRRRRRVKAAPPLLPRHFAILRVDHTIEPVFVLSVELDDGHLVLRNQAGAIEQIVARGQWREIRPATMAEMVDATLPEVIRGAPPEEPDESREQATLVNENDLAYPPDPPERFVPSSPEEAQRILRELERRTAPITRTHRIASQMLRPRPARIESVHRWHIFRPGQIDLVLAISAARIVVAHSGTLIFLNSEQQPIYALAPGAWTSVERVVTEEAQP